MANEITIAVQLNVTKNGATVAASPSVVQTMTGDQMLSNVQIIGTTNEALVIGDVTPTGWFFIKNLDATNYVEVFLDNGNAQLAAKLLPSEFCLLKPGANIYARANTGACNCQIIAVEL